MLQISLQELLETNPLLRILFPTEAFLEMTGWRSPAHTLTQPQPYYVPFAGRW